MAKYVYIRYKTTCRSENAQLFFTTYKNHLLNETRSKVFTISPKFELFEYILDMSDNSEWQGVMKQLRFDPVSYDNLSEKGECEIENIEICDRLPVYESKKDYIKTQGVNGWGYYTYNNGITYREMIWNEDNERWQAVNDANLYIDMETQTANNHIGSVRKWICPANGTYKIIYEYESKTGNELSTLKIRNNHKIISTYKFDEKKNIDRVTQEKTLYLETGEAVSFEFYSENEKTIESIESNMKIINELP